MSKRPEAYSPIPSPVSGRRTLAWAVGIAVAAVAAYHNSFAVPFFFDDTLSITQNESIRELWKLGRVLWPPVEAGTGGRPLLNFSFAVNYAAGGLGVWGYHAVNLAIHVAAGWVLFGLVRRTLRQPVMGGRFGRVATDLGGAAALLWVVHPLQTESVTYLSQRAEALAGFFYLLTLYGCVRVAEESGGRRWRWVAVGAFFAGVLAKEIVATAPVVALLYDAIFLSGSLRAAWRERRGTYVGLASGLVLLAILMATSELSRRGVGFGEKISWLDYVTTELEAVALYLKLSVWPHPLVIDYGLTPARGGGVLWISALVVVGVVGATLVGLWRRPVLGFAGAWVLVILAPTSSVVPVAIQPTAEHRMYLPLAGVVVLAVTLAYRWAGRAGLVGMLVVAAGFGWMTERRNEDYRSKESIWRATIAARPDNWRARSALALALFEQQRLADGIEQVSLAIQLNPTEAKLFNNLANALAAAGRSAEAIAAGKQAVALDPDYADARNSLANALLKAGRLPEAVEQFQEALRRKTSSVEIHCNLADALRQVGRLAEAVEHGEAALRLKPEFAEAHGNLGLALAEQGKLAEAVGHYEAALRLRPSYLEVRNNLGVALLNAGRLAEALAVLAEALRQKPDYAVAHNSLGIVLAKIGRVEEAGGEFEAALRIKPDYVNARENLRVLRAMQAAPAAPRE